MKLLTVPFRLCHLLYLQTDSFNFLRDAFYFNTLKFDSKNCDKNIGIHLREKADFISVNDIIC